MNKYAFLVYHRDYKDFLLHLRSLGVVHVKSIRPVADNDVIRQLTAEEKRIKGTIEFLNKFVSQNDEKSLRRSTVEQLTFSNIESVVERFRETIAKAQSETATLEKEREQMAVWGNFKYENITRLREAGYDVKFYTCRDTEFAKEYAESSNVFIINKIQATVYFISITKTGDINTGSAELVRMSLKDYSQLTAKIESLQTEIKQAEYQLQAIADEHLDTLKDMRKDIENHLAWNNVVLQTSHEAADKLMFLEGWIPAVESLEMEKEVSKKGFYCKKQEITDDDTIPIKLKNNRFTRLFEPITKLYSLPNYGELDPTPLFAPFFMLFFGLCLGDGGYGLLLVATALLLKRKVSDSVKPILTLLLFFGITTTIVGILTGSFFGFSLIEIESMSSVKNYFITSDNLMIISLVIGFFHVLYGKFVAAVKLKIQRGLKYSLAAFAWIFFILAVAVILVLPMMKIQIHKLLEYAMYGVAGLCALVMLFYNTPGKKPFVNLGSGIWAAYNTVSGLVGDVLSYIRLYAIGLTGALLGGVFNSMAIDMTATMNPFVRWLPMLLILLVGHALNIALSLISSLVHPLRLIYVEYYKNAEFEGGGLDYSPFRKV
ncbi:MAG: ATPase [Tannerella sp.]|nr:ATPase [Tannerella sp.]